MVDLSVCILKENNNDITIEAVKSFLENIYMISFEIIILVNNSWNGDLEVIKNEFSSYENVKVINNNATLSYAKAYNKGFSISEGRYFMILNGNTKIFDFGLSRVIQYLDNNEDIGILGTKVLSPDYKLQNSCDSFPNSIKEFFKWLGVRDYTLNGKVDKLLTKIFKNKYKPLIKDREIIDVDFVFRKSLIIRREAFEDKGFFDENFSMHHEDMEFCYRFKNSDWGVVYYPFFQVINYEKTISEDVPNVMFLEKYKGYLYYFDKHKLRVKGLLFKMVISMGSLFKIIKLKYLVRKSINDSKKSEHISIYSRLIKMAFPRIHKYGMKLLKKANKRNINKNKSKDKTDRLSILKDYE